MGRQSLSLPESSKLSPEHLLSLPGRHPSPSAQWQLPPGRSPGRVPEAGHVGHQPHLKGREVLLDAARFQQVCSNASARYFRHTAGQLRPRMALGAKQRASVVRGRPGNLAQLQGIDEICIDAILSLKVEAWQHSLHVIWKASSVLPESTCHKHKGSCTDHGTAARSEA